MMVCFKIMLFLSQVHAESTILVKCPNYFQLQIGFAWGRIDTPSLNQVESETSPEIPITDHSITPTHKSL